MWIIKKCILSKEKLKEVGLTSFREWMQLEDSVYIGHNYRKYSGDYKNEEAYWR